MKKWHGFERGVNFGGWFSQCDYTEGHYDSFIRPEDFSVVKAWGLDHVRVPVDYNLLLRDDGTFSEEGFARLENCALLCEKNGLNMVLDLHKAKGFSFDDGEAEEGFFESPTLQNMFVSLWMEIARRFGEKSFVAFELLNEVTSKEYMETWNGIIARTVAAIRPFAPETPIVIGGYWNNAPEAVAALLPPPDENIVYTFHCYSPLIFTHQGAPWIEGMDPDFRMRFDAPLADYAENTSRWIGKEYLDAFPEEAEEINADYFLNMFSEAVRVAEKAGVPLYCGEYGVIDRAMPEDAVKWYRRVHEAFERLGISRAAWSYRKMDFGLADQRYDELRGELLSLL